MIVIFPKTLRDLRQRPRSFDMHMVSKSKEYDFDQFGGDHCTFRSRDKLNPWKVNMMLDVHVDDIIVAI